MGNATETKKKETVSKDEKVKVEHDPLPPIAPLQHQNSAQSSSPILTEKSTNISQAGSSDGFEQKLEPTTPQNVNTSDDTFDSELPQRMASLVEQTTQKGIQTNDEKFKKWLKNEVQLGKYFDIFKASGYNDINYVPDFDKELLSEIGNIKKLDQKRILRKCKEYKSLTEEFYQFMKKNKLSVYRNIFAYYHIYTMADLRDILIVNPGIFEKNKNKSLNMSRMHVKLIFEKLQMPYEDVVSHVLTEEFSQEGETLIENLDFEGNEENGTEKSEKDYEEVTPNGDLRIKESDSPLGYVTVTSDFDRLGNVNDNDKVNDGSDLDFYEEQNHFLLKKLSNTILLERKQTPGGICNVSNRNVNTGEISSKRKN